MRRDAMRRCSASETLWFAAALLLCVPCAAKRASKKAEGKAEWVDSSGKVCREAREVKVCGGLSGLWFPEEGENL